MTLQLWNSGDCGVSFIATTPRFTRTWNGIIFLDPIYELNITVKKLLLFDMATTKKSS